MSETSLIVTWLGDACGKVKTVVRGVRKGCAPLLSGIDLFAEADIVFSPPKRGDLHHLKEFRLLDAHSPAHSGYPGLLACAYFAELCEWVVEPSTTNPEFHALLHRALAYLEQNIPTPQVIVHFETRLCQLLGIEVRKEESHAAIHRLAAQCGRPPQSRKRLMETLRNSKTSGTIENTPERNSNHDPAEHND